MLKEIIKRVNNLTVDQQKNVLEYLNSLPTDGERGYSRKTIPIDVDAVVGDKVIQTDSRDISASGIYINVSGSFKSDKGVKVVFSIPGQKTPFKLAGKIVRIEPTGMAISFEELSPYLKKMLDDMIWK